jgi:hypothetical protein
MHELQIYDLLETIRERVIRDYTEEHRRKYYDIVSKWYQQLSSDVKITSVANKLNHYWQIPTARLNRFCNGVDLPFLRLCLFMETHRIKYDYEQFIFDWRRMKSIGQQHIITYIRMDALQKAGKYGELKWENIVGAATNSYETLHHILTSLKDDKCVDYRLREILGCSMQADIHEAWKKWIVKNHPDKGGSHENFTLASAAYEEWKSVR